jgi:hypothetical protein
MIFVILDLKENDTFILEIEIGVRGEITLWHGLEFFLQNIGRQMRWLRNF